VFSFQSPLYAAIRIHFDIKKSAAFARLATFGIRACGSVGAAAAAGAATDLCRRLLTALLSGAAALRLFIFGFGFHGCSFHF
jgi:hypothetical protein